MSPSSRIQKVQADPQPLLDVSFHPLNISINVLFNIEAILNPTSAIEPLVEQLLIIERMQVRYSSNGTLNQSSGFFYVAAIYSWHELQIMMLTF